MTNVAEEIARLEQESAAFEAEERRKTEVRLRLETLRAEEAARADAVRRGAVVEGLAELANAAADKERALQEASERACSAIGELAREVEAARAEYEATQRKFRAGFEKLVPGFHSLGWRDNPGLRQKFETAIADLGKLADLDAIRRGPGVEGTPLEDVGGRPPAEKPAQHPSLEIALRIVRQQRAGAQTSR